MNDAAPLSDSADMPDRQIVAWLAKAGLQGMKQADLLAGFGERLVAAGLPVARGNLSMETLHPELRGYSFVWRRGEGIADRLAFAHGEADRPEFAQSPMLHMLANRLFRMRRRLDGPREALAFPIFREFQDRGLTEWYGAVFPFGWSAQASMRGEFGMITTWAVDAPDGFGEAGFALLEAMLPAFALAVKSAVTREIAEAVVTTYLGPDAGRRVLSGEIRRGAVETIHAVVFYADLRGFTRLADTVPRGELIGMLDDYLEQIAEPVETRGGQVLKFLGDGLLATFALDGQDTEEVCGTALAAAREALDRVAAMNAERAAAGRPVMALDVALHMGEVLYGNVGSARRLEFTVIGPTVNEAARIEALCDEMQVNLLASESFFHASGARGDVLVSLGRHRLRGVGGAQELYTLAAEDIEP